MLLAEMAGAFMKLRASSACPALVVQTNPVAFTVMERSTCIDQSCSESCKVLHHRCYFSSGYLSVASVFGCSFF